LINLDGAANLTMFTAATMLQKLSQQTELLFYFFKQFRLIRYLAKGELGLIVKIQEFILCLI